jgi:hypothetical protein
MGLATPDTNEPNTKYEPLELAVLVDTLRCALHNHNNNVLINLIVL